MDEIDILDMLKAGRANPMPKEQAIRILVKILTPLIEKGYLKGDPEEEAELIYSKRVELTDG